MYGHNTAYLNFYLCQFMYESCLKVLLRIQELGSPVVLGNKIEINTVYLQSSQGIYPILLNVFGSALCVTQQAKRM